MKFKFLLLLLVVLITQVSTAQNQVPVNYSIDGNIVGLGDKQIYLVSQRGSWPAAISDTAVVTAKNGRFQVKGNVEYENFADIILDEKNGSSFSLILQEGTIRIDGHIDSLELLRITGTKDNDLNTKSNLQLQQIRTKRDQLLLTNYYTQFIRDHPDALTCADYLFKVMYKVPPDTADALYNRLTPRVRRAGDLSFVREQINIKLRTAVGAMALDFSVTDINNTVLTAQTFRGKYLLLDFWASWCVPCRKEHPGLKKIYENYQSKNFTILSLSIDENAGKWKQAIAEDGMPWHHARDTNRADPHAVSRIYGIMPVPANFLISPEGKIIAVNLNSEALAIKLQEIFNGN